MSRRSTSSFIPRYKENAVLQLISASGIGYLLFQLAWNSFIIFTPHPADSSKGHDLRNAANELINPAVGLSPLRIYAHHWWTLLTYGWADASFWNWLTNMVWLYCFGNVLQGLVGYRQVIPTFIYGLLGGGIVCLLAQLIPGAFFLADAPQLTAQAGVMALAAAALTIAPRYRLYIGPEFSVPMWIVALIYLALNIGTNIMANHQILSLSIGGIISGFICMKFLQRGYKPGDRIYGFIANLTERFTPAEHRSPANGRRTQALRPNVTRRNKQAGIDDILDKINQKGYESLSAEERETLLRASKD